MSKGGSRYGAGRPGWHVKAEECRQIDVREWQRVGCFESGSDGTWYFTDRTTVHYRAEADVFVLRHDFAGRPMEQQVPITRTACHYGGERPWFTCPRCARRVALLYLTSGDGFACRRCSTVAYASQREDAITRSWRRQSKIERQLGVHHARPEGMRQTRYTALLHQIVHCEEQRASALMAALKRLRPGLAV